MSPTPSPHSHDSTVTDTTPRVLSIRAAGLCCAVGYHLDAAACAVRANVDHFQESEFVSREGDPIVVARLPGTERWGQARLAHWLELALRDCLRHTPALDTQRVPLLWLAPTPAQAGTPDASWYTEVFKQAEAALGHTFHPSSLVLPLGRAGLAAALEQAARLLTRHGAPHVLLAGADSYLNAATINHHLHADRLQVPGNSDGFLPGEAAASVLLHMAPANHVAVQVVGLGEGQESGRPDGSVPSRAQGLSQALRSALGTAQQVARIAYTDLDFRMSDQNGEAFFAREAANALTRVAPVGGQQLPLLTIADCLGEVGAATGVAMLALLTKLMPHPEGPGRTGLLHLANEHGERCAVITHCPTA
jgi:3-oxoacyl-[acyl-carrier-protein] synthase I